MDLQGKRLDKWFLTTEFNEACFPYDNKDSYQKKYDFITTQLSNKVQQYVNSGALINNDGLLTDHGPDHIKMVISRVTSLLECGRIDLSPYEVYILLMAINIHDTGNIYGRIGHEWNAHKLVEELRTLNIDNLDYFEWQQVFDIAVSHGGKIADDPIGKLRGLDHAGELEIRPKLLAALLRFGDELSENKSRAARYMLNKGVFPEKSKIYHIYADALESVVIDKRDSVIRMNFKILDSYVNTTFPKYAGLKKAEDGSEVEDLKDSYLIDEIFLRTLKTHYERLYCGTFLQPDIYLNSIVVSIYIFNSKRLLKTLSYELINHGIGEVSINSFYGTCPSMKEVCGESVKNELSVSITTT